MKCPKCGAKNPLDALYCTICGVEIPHAEHKIRCNRCGNILSEHDAFCVNCGTPVSAESSSAPMKVDICTGGEKFIAFLIPVIGFVLAIMWHRDYPKKSSSICVISVFGILLYVLFVLLVAGMS